ncbi:MAG: hypothetical protein IJG53_01110 [Eggerthellaceae bacterium]|nr:hypothetical protein [Eggerthellaceae bacterium]
MAKLFSRITAAAAALCAALFGAGCSGNDPGANEPVDVYGPPDPEMFEAIYGPRRIWATVSRRRPSRNRTIPKAARALP